MIARFLPVARIASLVLMAATFAVPATAQFSQREGYKFLEAIKDSKNDEVLGFLEKPGATPINTRDPSTGDTALHIVIRRGDTSYLNYLLAKGADPNIRNGKGETPLMLAVMGGEAEMVSALAKANARVDFGDPSGQTPLILAVQRHSPDLVRVLLDLGADPDQKDLLQGFSAREYAHQDTRSGAIAQMIDATPKKARRAVSGPKL